MMLLCFQTCDVVKTEEEAVVADQRQSTDYNAVAAIGTTLNKLLAAGNKQ